MTIKEYPIIVATIDEYYFKTVVGRKPKDQDELYTFAHSIEKGVEYSIDWENINSEAVHIIKGE